MIRNALAEDSAAIAAIYNYYVGNTVVTFEEVDVSPSEMWQRISIVQQRFSWLVYEMDNRVVGYAYAGAWKQRSAYRHAVEISVYLDPLYSGRGIGTMLYTQLIEDLKQQDVHAVIGGIALPNDASIKLHEHFGFQKIGQFREVGWKMNRWVDVGYWELIL